MNKSLPILAALLALALGGAFWFVRHRAPVPVALAATPVTAAETWTPERMLKEPVDYLKWAGRECTRTAEALSSARLALRAQRSQIERTINAREADATGYDRLLTEAKALYKRSEAEQKWPADFRGSRLSEADLRERILDAHGQLDAVRESIAANRVHIAALNRRLSEIERRLFAAEKLQTQLETELEVARANKTVAGLAGLSDQVTALKAVQDELDATPQSVMTLDTLAAKKAGSGRTNESFEAILAH